MGTKAPGALERAWGGGGKSQTPLSLQGPLAKLAAVFLPCRAWGLGGCFPSSVSSSQVFLQGFKVRLLSASPQGAAECGLRLGTWVHAGHPPLMSWVALSTLLWFSKPSSLKCQMRI